MLVSCYVSRQTSFQISDSYRLYLSYPILTQQNLSWCTQISHNILPWVTINSFFFFVSEISQDALDRTLIWFLLGILEKEHKDTDQTWYKNGMQWDKRESLSYLKIYSPQLIFHFCPSRGCTKLLLELLLFLISPCQPF